jgi:hypothetical protein
VGDVLEFPSRRTQGLAFLNRELRALLAARGADEALIDFATGQLTQLYGQISEAEQYSFSIELPATLAPADKESLYRQINTGLEGIRRENHSIMVKLIAQLVLAEVRLFQHERPED